MTRKTIIGLVIAFVACLMLGASLLLLGMDSDAIRFAEHDSVARPLVLLLALAIGMLFLFAAIAVGIYVYRDARERGMDPLLWTLVAVLVPYFIGLVVYLIVRQSHRATCPKCNAAVPEPALFCQQCGRVLRPKCPSCGVPAAAGARFCANCGSALQATSDQA